MTHPSHSSSDRIRLTGLSARGYHGVLPSERQEGQLFSVDLVLDLGQRGTAVAAQTDSLDDAVDYSVIAGQVIEVIEGEPVNLIETLAERVADVALAHHRVRSAHVTVHKPQAPLTVAFDDVAVSILRTADTEWEDDGASAAAPAAAPAPAAVPPAPLPSAEDEAAAAAGLPETADEPGADETAGDVADADAQAPPEAGLEDSELAAAALAATPVAAPTGGAAAAAAAFAAASLAADESERATEADDVEPADATEEQDDAETEEPPAFEIAPQDEAAAEAAPETEQPEEAEPQVDPLDARPEGRPAEVVIALGGNVGGVVPALRQAVATLRETEGVEVTAVAPLARTQALTDPGSAPQPDYLNTVVLARTSLSPREVLDLCHQLEDAAGRVRTEHWGPRTLDADLVDYEGVTSDDAELTLPHPRAAERAFVLVPWSQADPFAELGGQVVATLAEEAPDRDGVRWLALDWIDSDHLPALPTGQYVAPPAPSAESAPAPADGPESQGI
ncbi:2-amino-4-hydroxy-6-hydroxymethyldihydropteridine diphosphokinase [Actinomyces radicidentis]|uniref:2-amino-4-hydroxy-6- hydroxymethyldihydropteridine diphosphokinase n=1 Tax=Actinomyces radicidentis TaxID=111015 RepID=UPI0026E10BE1|nr:2-amino-4-hydroxy-6-hydroxymethyldihydropteridine diphosphokinase [Actinomyces radicidentis]